MRDKLGRFKKGHKTSQEIREKIRKSHLRGGSLEEKTCLLCGKKFIVLPCQSFRKYCSRKCAFASPKRSQSIISSLKEFAKTDRAKEMRQKTKETCIKRFTGISYKKRYGEKRANEIIKKQSDSTKENLPITTFKKGLVPWNKGIKWEAMSGENNPCWRGGISKIGQVFRSSPEYGRWRSKIFRKDNWTCKKCGETGIRLIAHHILNFAEHFEIRLNIDNGITFCVPCHKEFHNIYGRENNNQEQINKFLYDTSRTTISVSEKVGGRV